MNNPSDALPEGIQVTAVRAFQDNYIWCLHNNATVVAVDPGDAAPLLAFCREHTLKLGAVLITHHHRDHTGGIAKLASVYPNLPVIGPAGGHIRGITKSVDEGDVVRLPTLGCELSVIEVPGHTLDHLAFFGHGVVFCGDTLFSAGCGRLFEGSAEQMHHSLNKLKRLPDNTLIYCTHEYTQSNIQFAMAVEPGNSALQDYADKVNVRRQQDKATLPTQMAREKAINPFLRTHCDEVCRSAEAHCGAPLANDTAVFAAIRRWKDEF
ncbi:hydroxyacylglutathione hydrolase [Aestuariibacter sp. A3R04]|uniref:hydroxyacylglutathione hydrolase n=1 Tax=Aestuariibacter sp. A3R04 TaxID=2841571 RepID=UPI001C09BD74|nr:hydroxyacylglutathione hydrolase [Aestuariibacter sp. A3R04]MBU3023284.1 hydroxyacylglutathione hydrolase [Aestuariibacter sp. A3R04]